MKKIIVYLLLLSVLSGTFSPIVFAMTFENRMESLGYITEIEQQILSEGLVYTELSSNNDKNQKAYIFEYSPNNFTCPQVEYGSNTSSKSRLKDITSKYEKSGKRVVGAMNGDFFSFKTGVPMGTVIKDGILISSDPSKNAIGFRESGEAVIGNPEVHFLFSYEGKAPENSQDTAIPREKYTFNIDYFNKYPSVYAIYLLNDAYSKTTKSASPSTEIVLKPIYGSLNMNSRVTFEISEIYYHAIDTPIPEGCFVISADDRSFAPQLSACQKGDTLSMLISANSQWNGIKTALGGGDIILKDGKVMEDIVDEAHEKQNNPRTAIGLRENGEAVFFANDGRKANVAVGVDLITLAQIMKDMQCTTAINLDGGGSTTVYAATPFDTTAKLVNNPSDGSERYVSNAILFLNNAPESKEVGGIRIPFDYDYMMVGSTAEFAPIYYDKSYRPLVTTAIPTFSEITYNKSPRGHFTGNKFTAEKAGITKIEALLDSKKGLLSIEVLGSPDTISAKPDKILLSVNQTVDLDIKAFYNGKEVLCNNKNIFNYKIKYHEYEDEKKLQEDLSYVGYVENGVFRATDCFNGILEISLGDAFLQLPLEILPGDYSKDISEVLNASCDNYTLTLDESNVSYLGKDYSSILANGTSQNSKIYILCNDYQLNSNTYKLSFFTRSDVPCSVELTDENSNTVTIPYTLDRDYTVYNGWKKMSADLSNLSGKQKIKNLVIFEISKPQEIIFGGFEEIFGKELLYSDIEQSWAKENITDVYYQELMKGKPYQTTTIFDGNAILTRAEFATIICRFLNVDLTKYIDYPLDYADIDTVGDWAWSQIRAVSSLGLMGGSTENDGNRYFRPQSGITRAEAMQVIGRFLTDPSINSPLDFTDKNDIPSWALHNISKVVTYKIISGYEDNTIRASNTLTRNEAAKIFSLFNQEQFHNLIAV